MSTSAVKAIALCSPIVACNFFGFAPRRLKRSIKAMDSNVAESIGNLDLCAGQTLKGIRATNDILKTTESSAAETIKAMNNAEVAAKGSKILDGIAATVKNAEKSSKLLKGVSDVVRFTADHINPVIYTVAGFKVFGSKNDDEPMIVTGAEEAGAICTMRLGEELYSNTMGMPIQKFDKDLKRFVSKERPMNKHVETLLNDIKTKSLSSKKIAKFAKSHENLLKTAPGIAKGTGFVLTSIISYNLGDKAVKKFLDTEENTGHQAA